MSEIQNDRAAVSPGFHYGRVAEVVEKTGPKGEYWQYTIAIEEETKDAGKELPYRVSLSPDARWKALEFLDAVGAPEEGSTKSDTYLGALVKVHVIEGTYNDKTRPEIDGIFAPDIPDTRPAASKPPKLVESADEIPF